MTRIFVISHHHINKKLETLEEKYSLLRHDSNVDNSNQRIQGCSSNIINCSVSDNTVIVSAPVISLASSLVSWNVDHESSPELLTLQRRSSPAWRQCQHIRLHSSCCAAGPRPPPAPPASPWCPASPPPSPPPCPRTCPQAAASACGTWGRTLTHHYNIDKLVSKI